VLYDKLQRTLGYVFSDAGKLRQALTHSSFVYENDLGAESSNERLEFLGDAVLELLASEYLFKKYIKLTEGELSKRRATLVCETTLSNHARRLGLGNYLRLGRGETTSGGADKDSILSDALEAIIGAIYLDGGIKKAQAFVVSHLLEADVSVMVQSPILDPKSTLQEKIQKFSREPLVYETTDETGPAHQKLFTVRVIHEGKILGTGSGKSKKEAEQEAAGIALKSY